MTDDSDTRTKVRAMFLAFVMVTSVFGATVAFSGTAAAQSVNTISPADIPTDTSSTTHTIADPNTAADDLTVSSLGGDGNQVAIIIELDPLVTNGIDISNADVTATADSAGNQDDTSILVDRVNQDANEIRIVAVDDNGDTGSTQSVEIDGIELTGLDTTNADTASGLSYLVRADNQNGGDFGSGFTTDTSSESNNFNIAGIEVENVATGNTVVETNLGAAIEEVNDPTGGDLSSGSAGDQQVIRLESGTFVFDRNDIASGELSASNVRIQPVEGANVTIQSAGASVLRIASGTTGVEIQNLTIDMDSNGATAIQIRDNAAASISGVTFTNIADIEAADAVTAADGSETVSITGSTFDADGVAAEAIEISSTGDESLDLTFEDNTVSGFEIGVPLSTVDGVSAVSISGNTFENNVIPVRDTGSAVNLNDVFANNDFGTKFVTVEDSNGDIQNAVYGTLASVQNDGATSIDTADHTTTIAGEHSADQIDITSNGVTLQAADGADTATITATGANDILRVGQGASTDVNGLTVDDVTFDLDGNDAGAIVQQGGNDNIDDLTVTNSEFLNIGGTSSAAIDLDSVNDIDGLTVNNNKFDSSNNYQALSLSGDNLAANSDVTVRDNTIEDSDAAAIDLGQVNDGSLDVTVNGNQILNQSSGTTPALQVQVGNGNDEVLIQNNEITGDGDAVGIALSGADVSGVSIQANDISGLDDGSGANAIAIDLNDAGDGNTATVENNELEGNEVHLDDANDDYDEQSLIDNNVVTRVVLILDQEGGDIQNNNVYGTVTAGVADEDGASTEFIDVGAGTYDENSIAISDELTLATDDGATLTTDTSNSILDINGPDGTVTVTGFSFEPTADNANADINIGSTTTNNVVVQDNVFTGPGTSSRQAVLVDDIGAATVTITVSDNDFDNYAQAVELDDSGSEDSTLTLNVVRNGFTDSSEAVNLVSSDTSTADTINVNFNNIVGNDDGVVVDVATGTHTVNTLANWWGAETGPAGQFNGDGDTVTGANAGDANVDPWLEGPVTNLPTDQYVVVPDPQPPIADGTASANVLVATLNDTLATGEDETTTTLLANNSGPLSISEVSGAATAADPIDYTVTSDTAGAYQLTARNNDGNIPRGSAVQTYTGTPTDVEVTAENDTLVAGDSSTVNATLTLVDSNGNAVDPGANFGVTFLIDGASDAGVTRVTDEDLDTSTPNSEARLEISADTSDVELEITGVYDDQGFSDSVNVTTVQNQMNVTVTPSTVTAGNDTDIEVEAVDAASGSGIDSANVELSGAGVSQTLLTNSSGVATTSVNASEAGTIDVNVSADGFDDATESITVEAAPADADPEDPVDRFDTNGEPGIQSGEVLNAISAFNEGEEGVEDGDVLDVISAFNEA